MNTQQARQAPAGMTGGQFKALTHGWKYSPQEISGLNKETASELLDACSRAGHKLDGVAYKALIDTEVEDNRNDIEARGILVPVITDSKLNELFSDLTPEQKEDEEQLRRELRQAEVKASEAMEWMGRVLFGYKQVIPHKKWLPFLDIIGIHHRLAQRCIELAGLSQQLGPTMTRAMNIRGVGLTGNTGSPRQEEIKKIAQKVIEKRHAYLDSPLNSNTSTFDAFGGVISDEQDQQFLEEAIHETREQAPQVEDTPEVRERRITVFESSIKHDMTGLRGIYQNDDAFKMAMGRIYKEVMALQIIIREAVNA